MAFLYLSLFQLLVSCCEARGAQSAHIITTVFNGYSEEREQEVYTAIWNNMKLSYVSKVR